MNAVLVSHRLLTAIVCLPSTITDLEAVQSAAESLAPCGTTHGWFVHGHDAEPGKGPLTCEDDLTRTHWLVEA